MVRVQKQMRAAEEKHVILIEQRDEADHHTALLEIKSDELDSTLLALQLQLTVAEEQLAIMT